MEKVSVTDLSLIGENHKGFTYAAYAEGRDDFLIIQRNAKTINGCHFHKGISPDKDPEILYVIEGEAELYCYDLQNQEEKKFTVRALNRVEIFPYVWHELKTLRQILFLEMNGLNSHRRDTFYETKSFETG